MEFAHCDVANPKVTTLHLIKAYGVTSHRYRKSHTKIEVNIYFAVYGFKILCDISKDTFEISRKIFNPYTAKYAFYEMLKIWWIMIS